MGGGAANSNGTYEKDQLPVSLLRSYTQRAHCEEERHWSWEIAVLSSGTRTYKPVLGKSLIILAYET